MSQLEEIRKYWNLRADGYSRSIWDELGEKEEEWKERMAQLLGSSAGKKALDLGCGPGMFTMLLTGIGYEVTAFDYSDEMLKKAEKNVREREYTAKFMRGDAQNLPFEDACFDVIVTRNLTWNLERPERAYEEWIRVLKPGGILLNFDGNHYRYFYDSEYLAAREAEQYQNGQGHKYMENIDVSVIDRIAETLPLSKCDRPKWDLERLLEQKVREVTASVQWRSFSDREGSEHKIAANFLIRAVK